MRLALLARPIPRTTLAWTAGVVAVTWVLRLLYPVAAVLFGHARALPGSALVVAALGVSVLRARLVHAATTGVRHELYDALSDAIRRHPVLASRDSEGRAQVENEISRGLPSVETLFAETLPSLLGSVLALPVVAWLAVRQVGLGALTLAAAALGCGVLAAALLARGATRLGSEAWTYYQRIATLIEQGFAGRAELRVHQLTGRHRRDLLDSVDVWTVKMGRVRLLQSLTSWSVPIVAAAAALAFGALAGHDVGAVVAGTLVDPRSNQVVAWALGLTALPIMTNIAGAFASSANARPYLAALERFVESSTDRLEPERRSEGSLDDIVVDAEFVHAAQRDEPAVHVRARFEWAPGELLAITGPNGAGKSTVSLMLMGLVTPTSGGVRVTSNGASRGPEALAGRIAYLAQTAYFDDGGTIAEALRFVAPEITSEATLAMLSRLFHRELDPSFLDRPCSALSSGQRRTVALARVLLRRADVVILDEPEANLDLGTRREAIALIRAAARDRRIMLLTHDPEFAAAADRVLAFEGHSLGVTQA